MQQATSVTETCGVGWSLQRVRAWLALTLPPDSARSWEIIGERNEARLEMKGRNWDGAGTGAIVYRVEALVATDR